MSSSVSTPNPPHQRLAETITTTEGDSAATIITPPSLTISASGPKPGSASASASVSKSRPSTSVGPSSNNSAKDSPSSCPPRVVYGTGAVAHLPTELGRLRVSSPLVVSSPSRISLARRIQSLVPNLDSRILDSALVSVSQRVVDEAVARISGRDCVISVGGGSAVKLAKAISLQKHIPHICIPTTYSGTEMHLLGDAARRGKKSRHRPGSSGSRMKSSGTDTGTMPTIIIYDEDLTSTNTSMTISVRSNDEPPVESRCRRSSNDDDAQWSYIHLPGV